MSVWGKSTMVIYDRYRQCEYEGEITHNRYSFEKLNETLISLTQKDGQAPDIVFEATGVYSKPLERFLGDQGYMYYRVNPLEANIQMASMRRQKQIKATLMNLRKLTLELNVNKLIKKRNIINKCVQ